MNKWENFLFSLQKKKKTKSRPEKIQLQRKDYVNQKILAQDGIDSGFCSSCERLLGGRESRGVERVWEIPGILHKLIGISDVCQAKPEDGPHSIDKATITVLKIPVRTRIRPNQQRQQLCCILRNAFGVQRDGHKSMIKTEIKSEMSPPCGRRAGHKPPFLINKYGCRGTKKIWKLSRKFQWNIKMVRLQLNSEMFPSHQGLILLVARDLQNSLPKSCLIHSHRRWLVPWPCLLLLTTNLSRYGIPLLTGSMVMTAAAL